LEGPIPTVDDLAQLVDSRGSQPGRHRSSDSPFDDAALRAKLEALRPATSEVSPEVAQMFEDAEDAALRARFDALRGKNTSAEGTSGAVEPTIDDAALRSRLEALRPGTSEASLGAARTSAEADADDAEDAALWARFDALRGKNKPGQDPSEKVESTGDD